MDIEKICHFFNNFGDGLILEFQFFWNSNNNQETFTFTIEAMNQTRVLKKVKFSVSGVQHFKLTHDRDKLNYQVISNGIHIVKFEDLWTVEFGTFADPVSTFLEVMESDFYVTGKNIQYQIME